MFKKLSIASLALAAALPMIGNAATVSFSTNLNSGWTATPNSGGGAFTSALQTASISVTGSISTLPSSSTIDLAGPNSITLNGTFANLSGFSPFADYYYTFTNATYTWQGGAGNSYNMFGPCGPSPACVQTLWTTNTAGATSPSGLVMTPASQNLSAYMPSQSASGITLVSGTVTCITGFSAACAAGREGNIFDIMNLDLSLNAAAGFAVIPAFTKLSLGQVSTSGQSAIVLTTAQVPVPAALWLFGSALGLLSVARRRGVKA